MATINSKRFAAGGATIALGSSGFLLQISGGGKVRIININDGPDQIPLVGMQARLAKVDGVEVKDAAIADAATALFKAIDKAPEVRARVR